MESDHDGQAAVTRPLVLLDVEASGLHPTSFPTEIAWVTADLSVGFSACIRPIAAWTWLDWNLEAEKVHGLDFSALQRHGEDVQAVAAALNVALADAEIMTDSPSKDGIWLRTLFDAAGVPPTFLLVPFNAQFAAGRCGGIYDLDCAITVLLRDLGGGLELADAHEALAQQLGTECGLVQHRALDDALLHAIRLLAVEVLALPPAERPGAHQDIVSRVAALRQSVFADQAGRGAKPRAACEVARR